MNYNSSFSDSLYADIKPSYRDSLTHHGIKGQKWGVRRFQNPDGTLTSDGRKRYYDKYATLSKEGREFNNEARKRFRSYRDATLYNARVVNPDFVKAEKRYNELQNMRSKQYKQDYNNFIKDKDFVGLDYEDFKDESYSRYRKTDSGKEAEELEKYLRKTLDDTAKEHPLYSKNFRQLRYFSSNAYDEIRNIPLSKATDDFETINYGKQVVNEIMNAIENGQVNDLKNW